MWVFKAPKRFLKSRTKVCRLMHHAATFYFSFMSMIKDIFENKFDKMWLTLTSEGIILVIPPKSFEQLGSCGVFWLYWTLCSTIDLLFCATFVVRMSSQGLWSGTFVCLGGVAPPPKSSNPSSNWLHRRFWSDKIQSNYVTPQKERGITWLSKHLLGPLYFLIQFYISSGDNHQPVGIRYTKDVINQCTKLSCVCKAYFY